MSELLCVGMMSTVLKQSLITTGKSYVAQVEAEYRINALLFPTLFFYLPLLSLFLIRKKQEGAQLFISWLPMSYRPAITVSTVYCQWVDYSDQATSCTIRGPSPGKVKIFFSSPKRPRPALGPTQTPIQCTPGFFTGLDEQGLKLTTYLHVVPRLKMDGVTTLLPLHAFMLWTGRNLPVSYLWVDCLWISNMSAIS